MSFTKSKKWKHVHATYSAESAHSQDSSSVDVDADFALIVRPKSNIVVSLRSERTGEWFDLSISPEVLYKVDVSGCDLLNVRLVSPGDNPLVRIRTLGRSFSASENQFESDLDSLEKDRGSFEWLVLITVVAS